MPLPLRVRGRFTWFSEEFVQVYLWRRPKWSYNIESNTNSRSELANKMVHSFTMFIILTVFINWDSHRFIFRVDNKILQFVETVLMRLYKKFKCLERMPPGRWFGKDLSIPLSVVQSSYSSSSSSKDMIEDPLSCAGKFYFSKF